MKIPTYQKRSKQEDKGEVLHMMEKLGAGRGGLQRAVLARAHIRVVKENHNYKKNGNTYYPGPLQTMIKSSSEPSIQGSRIFRKKRGSSPEKNMRSTANFGTPKGSISSLTMHSTARRKFSPRRSQANMKNQTPPPELFTIDSGIEYSHSTRTKALCYRGKTESYIFRETPLPQHMRLFYKKKPSKDHIPQQPIYNKVSKNNGQVLLENPYERYFVIPGGGTNTRNLEHLIRTRSHLFTESQNRWFKQNQDEEDQTGEEYRQRVHTCDNMTHSPKFQSDQSPDLFTQSPAPREFAMVDGFENTFKPLSEKRGLWDEDEPQIPVIEGKAVPYFFPGDPMSKVSEIDESNYDTGNSPHREGHDGMEMQFTFFNRN